MRKLTVTVEQDESGLLVGSVREIPSCHTQARTLDDLVARIAEAIRLHIGPDEDASAEVHGSGVRQVEVEV